MSCFLHVYPLHVFFVVTGGGKRNKHFNTPDWRDTRSLGGQSGYFGLTYVLGPSLW